MWFIYIVIMVILFFVIKAFDNAETKKNEEKPFLLHMDIVAAERYVTSKHPKDIKEAFRIRREAAFAGMFPPKMSKEWYDEHPAEKEFYKEYYDSLSYLPKDESGDF